MGILGNFSRANMGAMRAQSGAASITIGCAGPQHPERFRSSIMREGQTTALGKYAVPTGYNPQGSWRLPITAGEISMQLTGGGAVASDLYPSKNMVASVSGSGDIASTIMGLHAASVALTGSSTLAAGIEAVGSMIAALVGGGDIASALSGLGMIVGDLVGAGAMTADGSLIVSMTADLSGVGSLSAGASLTVFISVDLEGNSAFSATIMGLVPGAVNFAGSGDLVADLAALGEMLADLVGGGDLDATIAAIGSMSVDMTVFGTGLTIENVGTAVWNALQSQHLETGTMGAAMAAAGSAGDPWSTAIPGVYSAGTAGKIIGDALGEASIDGHTLTEILRILTAAIAGKNVGTLTNPQYNAVDDSKVRVSATVVNGKRTDTTVDGTP